MHDVLYMGHLDLVDMIVKDGPTLTAKLGNIESLQVTVTYNSVDCDGYISGMAI
jgi:hypothetical protein